MKRFVSILLVGFMLLTMLVGSTIPIVPSTGDTGTAKPDSTPQAKKEEITFIHHRTDIDATLIKGYIEQFNKVYPNIIVKTETYSDYDGQITIRMNSDDYGDALIMVDTINPNEYVNFFEKLGTATEMEKEYMWIRTSKATVGEDVFGIPTCGNAFGMIYNKRIFKEAGVTSIPKSPEEFINALKQVKEKTKAIPFYTNYAADWTLAGQYEDHRTSVSGDPDYVNSLVHMDDPFSAGKPHYIVYKLLYDVVKEGLVEDDPLTTDWESSKTRLATGEIATMMLGSWAIAQCQERGVQSGTDPADVSFMPFPYTNKDGKVYAGSGGDRNVAININSTKKEAARTWINYFLHETDYAKQLGALNVLKSKQDEFPEGLKAYQELGVQIITNTPAPLEEAGLLDKLDQQSEVGLWQSTFKKRIVEAAMGTRKETYDDIMNDLNTKWAKARKDLGIK
ncbi:MAG: carbohydrate ABC transporter substrate-binding protein [Ruminiclostridium sp.]|nr:carbohydrate ABC transporter substrate-binding protein [Ruminiclostridium sp.]